MHGYGGFARGTIERSKKSIIGKLSREGVYRREVYVSKTGEKPITKVEIVSHIAEGLGVEVSDLAGLEKVQKRPSNPIKSCSGVSNLRMTRGQFSHISRLEVN